jgi:hypothetical protein
VLPVPGAGCSAGSPGPAEPSLPDVISELDIAGAGAVPVVADGPPDPDVLAVEPDVPPDVPPDVSPEVSPELPPEPE